MNNNLVPERGKRYRISREVEVRQVLEYPHSNPIVRIQDQEGLRFRVSAYNWEEIEPDYKVGEMYVSALDTLWVRVESVSGTPGWVRYSDYVPGSPFFSSLDFQPHDYPKRPLKRVYLEKE